MRATRTIYTPPTDRKSPVATPAEVATYLRVSTRTLQGWRLTKTGPVSFLAGGHTRYLWADVDAWVEERRGGAA